MQAAAREQETTSRPFGANNPPSSFDDAFARIENLSEEITQISDQLLNIKKLSFKTGKDRIEWQDKAHKAIETRDQERSFLHQWIENRDLVQSASKKARAAKSASDTELTQRASGCANAAKRSAAQFEKRYGVGFHSSHEPASPAIAYGRIIYLRSLVQRISYFIEGFNRLANEIGVGKRRLADIKKPLKSIFNKAHQELNYLQRWVSEIHIESSDARGSELVLKLIIERAISEGFKLTQAEQYALQRIENEYNAIGRIATAK